ncbi:MAG TPA: efflux RND transporter periplasmic adaptor subunit [Thermodesulfobacteriota bacterium]|nr:efflux RND transporter periplasmic adaptor subunit [Thermodesulfobacteriota bacterium]
MPRVFRRSGLLFFTSLVALVLSLSCDRGDSKAEGSPGGGQGEGVPVTVARATSKDVPVRLSAIGNVEPYSTVEIKPQVEGQLSRVYFKEGENVKSGDLLFLIDPRPYENALRQAEANMARNTAMMKNAEQNAVRYEDLINKGVVSAQQYDQVKAEFESLKASVNADRSAVANAKLELEYCSIRSPIDGRIGEILVHEGNTVETRTTLLAVINQTKPVFVDFSVPEHFLALIREYLAASGDLKVYATIPYTSRKDGGSAAMDKDTEAVGVSPGDRPPAEGTLSFIDNRVNESTGTVRLKAVFENDDEALWPGKFVNVSLNLTTQEDVTVVPARAVQSGQSGDYVFVVKPDSTVESRPVVPGARVDREVVITKGLKPGEIVVTEGQLRLVTGMKVRVNDSPEVLSRDGSDVSMK